MARCLRYSHLAVAVTSVEEAEVFYAKVGFHRRSPDVSGVLSNQAGLGLCLIPTTLLPPEGKNVLMDMPGEKKYPGINHMSFGVPSVSSARAYLEKSEIAISGARDKLAVFVRDPSRNTLEFERNDGVDENDAVDESVLSNPPRGGIDHVGIRVGDTSAAAKWYAEALGFSDLVIQYDLDADPLKNFRPWIIRTRSRTDGDTSSTPADSDRSERWRQHLSPDAIDINLIPNCTMKLSYNVLFPPSSTEGSTAEHSKVADILPVILFVAFEVQSIREAMTALTSAGVETVTYDDVARIGIPPDIIHPAEAADCSRGGDVNSLFFCDPDGNVIRLVGPP